MKRLYFCFLASIAMLICGCKKDNSFCGANDPINDIEWLNDFVNNEYSPSSIDIYKAIYKDTSGFYLVIYIDSAKTSKLTSFTNCDGRGMCSTGGNMPPNCPGYSQHESYRELIYSR